MTLWVATTNPGKLREFALLSGGAVEFLPLTGVPAVEETGATFEENAILKALHYGPHAPGPLFAEDSGLEVDALNGAPGVHSARFAGASATGDGNNRLLIDRLRGVSNRAARYVSVIALVRDAKLLGTFRGEVEGQIVDDPRGAHGFGYDPHFFHPPFQCTFAEASPPQKLDVSHRGRALRAMLSHLPDLLR